MCITRPEALTEDSVLGHGSRMGRALALLLLASACGGRLETADGGTSSSGSGSGGTSSGGSGGGASSGTDFPVCPAQPPVVGTSCGAAGSSAGCAYLSGTCESFVCDASGHWQTSTEGC
jgi:hypothetical protein